jgi:hypothetical protein
LETLGGRKMRPAVYYKSLKLPEIATAAFVEWEEERRFSAFPRLVPWSRELSPALGERKQNGF